MNRMLIYKDKNNFNCSVEGESFSSFEEVLEYLFDNKIKIEKYMNDNLYFTCNNFSVKVEKYSDFVKESRFSLLNRKLKSELHLVKKYKLMRKKHKETKIRNMKITTVLLASIMVYNILPEGLVKMPFSNDNGDLSYGQTQTLVVAEVSDFEKEKNDAYQKYVNEKTEDFNVKYAKISLVFSTTSFEDIKRYANEFGLDYIEVLDHLEKNISNIVDTYQINDEFTIKLAMYDLTKDKDIVRVNNYTKEEMEERLLNTFEKYGVSDPETIATALAVFRIETGHATSSLYQNNNNFGGHGRELPDGSFIPRTYITPEVGVFRFFEAFERIKRQSYEMCNKEGIDVTNMPLSQVMSRIYAPGDENWLRLTDEMVPPTMDELEGLVKGRDR